MIRKLIPAAVLLSVMGVAQAEVTFYGLIDMSYGKNIADDAAGKNADFHSGGDDSSSQGNSTTRVGVKGNLEVAPGIKANFQLETAGITSEGRVGTKGADTPFFNRQAWAGFSGNFGEVRLGKQDSVAFQVMNKFDFNGAANAASAQGNVAVASWLPGRQARSLQYISPEMNGFKAQAGFVPAGNEVLVGDAPKSSTSLALSYTAGKLVVAVAGESKRTEKSNNFASVATSYDFGVAKVMASYADGGAGIKGTSVGVVAPVAGFNIGLTYAKNSDTQAVGTEFYVNREVFKNTYAYFDYGNVDKTSKTSQKGNAYAVGVIYTF
jgi:hypothetical protein